MRGVAGGQRALGRAVEGWEALDWYLGDGSLVGCCPKELNRNSRNS